MDKSDIIKMLDAEIRWCFDNPDEKLSKDYRKGFTNGLVQAKYLMNELASQPDVEADVCQCENKRPPINIGPIVFGCPKCRKPRKKFSEN